MKTSNTPAWTKLLPLLLLLALPAVAQEQFTYTVNNDGTITLTGYSGYASDLTVPSIYADATVTGIAEGAFDNPYGESPLRSVTIPVTVTNIQVPAFLGLTNVTVDPSNPDYSSLNGVLFDKAQATLLEFPLFVLNESYTIPASVTSIGDFAFYEPYYEVSGFSVIIPGSVTSIGDAAFYDCPSLTSIAIPASVTNIGNLAFFDCAELSNVTIGSGVTSIGNQAFQECSSLTNVTIGTGVTNIASDAFYECPKLASVNFQGNSPTPTNDLTVFSGDTNAIGYVLPGTTGWGTNFDGLPIMTNLVGTVVGSVSNIVGNVTVTHANGTTNTLQAGDSVEFGDTITTSAGGRAQIQFQDNTQLIMPEIARVTIDSYIYNPVTQSGSSFFNMLQGAFVYVSGLIGKNNTNGEHIQIETGSIGIRGTQFIVQQDPCSSTQEVYLIQGELAITPTGTPGVTNICDAPVMILITATNVTTNTLTQAIYNSVSNQVFQNTGIVTFPSWQEQYFGCTNNPNAAPNADPDGDGVSNYAEFLAGTNPTNKASCFQFVSAKAQGNNLLLTWLCGGGRTNILQATTNFGASWSNVSPNIVLAGGGDSVTNYLDAGAITNIPRRLYRVYLVP